MPCRSDSCRGSSLLEVAGAIDSGGISAAARAARCHRFRSNRLASLILLVDDFVLAPFWAVEFELEVSMIGATMGSSTLADVTGTRGGATVRGLS